MMLSSGEDKKSIRARMKKIFRPVSYPKEWEAEGRPKKDNA